MGHGTVGGRAVSEPNLVRSLVSVFFGLTLGAAVVFTAWYGAEWWRRRTWPRRYDVTGGADAGVFLTRWTIFSAFGWRLRVHLFRRPDVDSCLHDHPWSFWTLILRGGYIERNDSGHAYLGPGTLAFRPAEYRHRIVDLPDGRSWSLVVTSPKRREWGFTTPRGHWIPWRPFVDTPFTVRAPWCEEKE